MRTEDVPAEIRARVAEANPTGAAFTNSADGPRFGPIAGMRARWDRLFAVALQPRRTRSPKPRRKATGEPAHAQAKAQAAAPAEDEQLHVRFFGTPAPTAAADADPENYWTSTPYGA